MDFKLSAYAASCPSVAHHCVRSSYQRAENRRYEIAIAAVEARARPPAHSAMAFSRPPSRPARIQRRTGTHDIGLHHAYGRKNETRLGIACTKGAGLLLVQAGRYWPPPRRCSIGQRSRGPSTPMRPALASNRFQTQPFARLFVSPAAMAAAAGFDKAAIHRIGNKAADINARN